MIKLLSTLVLVLFFLSFSTKNALGAISFTISNPNIGSDGEVEVDATISGLISSSCSSSGCYLQARFRSSEGYFGYTQNNSGEFVDYFGTPESVEEVKTKLFNFVPTGGVWSGKIKAKNNSQNPYYFGPGDYPLSFRRFSGNSTSATSVESNALAVNLTQDLPPATPGPSESVPNLTPTQIPIALKTPAPTPQLSKSPTPVPVKSASPKASPTKAKTEDSETGTTLGISDASVEVSPSPSSEKSGETGRKFPWFAVVVIILGLSLVSVSVFLTYRKNKAPSLDG